MRRPRPWHASYHGMIFTCVARSSSATCLWHGKGNYQVTLCCALSIFVLAPLYNCGRTVKVLAIRTSPVYELECIHSTKMHEYVYQFLEFSAA